MISKAEFKERRKKVLNFLEELSKKDGKSYQFFVRSGSRKIFSNDVNYPFRASSDFYYLTGFKEANAIAVFDPSSQHPFTLFVEAVDPQHTIWEGHREGLEGAVKNFDADKAFDTDEFKEEKFCNAKEKDLTNFVHSLRSIKSDAEIALMQKSADIAVQAHRMAKEIITPGIYEYEVEAKLNQVFRSQGASGWAYPSIVAAGENSCILHYISNNEKIQKGDLILIDAGAEYEMYASDITRVHAATGEFTKEQKDVYDVVLEAQLKAMETIRVGNSFQETNDVVTITIAEGLQNLGYIKDKNDPNQIKKYYMHSAGHSLGLDVHDAGVDRKTSKYVPGMVTTIEPGIYIKEKKIGIRIEDDILITATGNRNLTEALAK
jgi:Xaa-Pro aminopeptidase